MVAKWVSLFKNEDKNILMIKDALLYDRIMDTTQKLSSQLTIKIKLPIQSS